MLSRRRFGEQRLRSGWRAGKVAGALIVGALIVAGATAVAARLAPGLAPWHAARTTTWAEAAWTLPLDNWGQGRVWRGATGAGDVMLFVRTKTGFCNCFSGIADDNEIDRIGDVDLHGDKFVPLAAGEITALGDLAGRKRAFQTSRVWAGTRHVLSIVVASDCKAVVATLVSDTAISPELEASAVGVLNGDAVRRWAAAQ